jgi:hypothetical protein
MVVSLNDIIHLLYLHHIESSNSVYLTVGGIQPERY